MQREFSVSAAAKVAHTSLDFAYIDARHDYEGLSEDLRAWWPKLCPGGLMAGHDYDNVNGMCQWPAQSASSSPRLGRARTAANRPFSSRVTTHRRGSSSGRRGPVD